MAKGHIYKYEVYVINYEEIVLKQNIKDEEEKEPDATQQDLDYSTPEM